MHNHTLYHNKPKSILIANGDGIGPEIMNATISILEAAKLNVSFDYIDVGEKVYLSGNSSGITDESFQKIKKAKIILKAPVTTPSDKGYKSINVTLRKALGLFANLRPVLSYRPFIYGLHDNVDMFIVRENEEDLYAGIEYRITNTRYLAFKLITSQGSEKIIRYAFEYAKKNNRKKVTCIAKNNIMKITDGHFCQIFNNIALDYPEIKHETQIVDIGAARIASKPFNFDVVVTLNLYGDIISDIASEVTGSIGICGSANIGDDYAVFEAVHGSAPDIAGKNIANPSGLLQAAIMMCNHINEAPVATLIHNAWLKTIEDGIHTTDIFRVGISTKNVSTSEFANAVIENLGYKPKKLQSIDENQKSFQSIPYQSNKSIGEQNKVSSQIVVGADIFIDNINDYSLNEFGSKLSELATKCSMILHLISQRGAIIWPKNVILGDFVKEMLRCRFYIDTKITDSFDASCKIHMLCDLILKEGIQIAGYIRLTEYDGVHGFSMAQGE